MRVDIPGRCAVCPNSCHAETRDSPLAMCRIEAIGNLNGDIEKDLKLQRPAHNAVLVSRALEQLHGNEGLAPMLPISKMVQILEWFRPDAARASRRKRSSDCGSCETSSGRNFSATKRPSSVSSAL